MQTYYGDRRVIGDGIVRSRGGWALQLCLVDEQIAKLQEQLRDVHPEVVMIAMSTLPARSWEAERVVAAALDNAEMLFGYAAQDILDVIRDEVSLSFCPDSVYREQLYHAELI